MAFLPSLKFHRNTQIFLLFTKELKEVHIIKRNSWIDREVADFVIQAHHIPAVGVLVLVLIVFYIEGGIDNSVNWYICCWDVCGAVVSINVELPINCTGYARNGGYMIVGEIDWFFRRLKQSNFFTLITISGSPSSETRRSIFPLGVWWVLPYPPSLKTETVDLTLRTK